MFRFDKWSGRFNAFVEVFKFFRNLRAYAYQFMYRRALGHCFDDMLCDLFFAGSNNHFDVCGITAVYNIFLCQQVSGRNNRSTQFVQSDDAEPEFITAFQDKHYHIPTAYAE